MRLPKFEYLEPEAVSEAVTLLEKYRGQCSVIAGGTDLLVAMKQRRQTPGYVLSLAKIPALKEIREEGGMLSIGPLATLEEVAASAAIREKLPLLSQAAWEVGSPLLRTVATIGGNLCLDTRCRFYNQSEFWRGARPECHKAGGSTCHVTNKENVCYSTFSGDIAPALIALNSQIRLNGKGGERVLPLADFYTGEGRTPNLLAAGGNEVLTEIKVPLPATGTGGTYRKYRFRESIDFPLVGLAALLRSDPGDGTCRDARLVISGVGSRPLEAVEAGKKLVGKKLNPDIVAEAAETAAAEARPVRTDRVGPQFKKKMVRALVVEVISELGGINR